MADIPIEKKSNPWWLWLLGLLLLGALGFFLYDALDAEDYDNMDTEPETAVVVADPEAEAILPASGTLTDLDIFLRVQEPSAYTGRAVDFDGVYVPRVPGDSVFFINTPSQGIDGRLLAVLEGLGEQQVGDGTGSDGRYNIDADERISLTGTIRPLSDERVARWGLTDAERLATKEVYLQVARVTRNDP